MAIATEEQYNTDTVFKLAASQWSLTIAIVFMTAEKFCQTVTMTANTKMQQQLLTGTIKIFTTSFKTIFTTICHRHVKQTKFYDTKVVHAIRNTDMLCNNLTL